jgi:hypothetical protein
MGRKKRKEVTVEEVPTFSIEIARADYIIHIESPSPGYTTATAQRLMRRFEKRKYGREFG